MKRGRDLFEIALDVPRSVFAAAGMGDGSLPARVTKSVWFDTSGRDLIAAGLALGIAPEDGAWRQATLAAGCMLADRVFSATPDPAAISDPQRRAAFLAAVGGRLLDPVFQIETRASPGQKEDGVAIVGVAHTIRAGGRQAERFEIRLAGRKGDCLEHARAVVGDGPFRLAPDDRIEEGYRLLAGKPGGFARRVRAGASPIGGHDSAAAALASTLLASARMIAANLSAVALSDDPEAVHQLRVGLRRFRSALRLFRPLLKPRVRKALNRKARTIGRIAGRLRDVDVQAAAGAAGSHDAVRDAVRAEIVAANAGGLVFDIVDAAARGPRKSAQSEAVGSYGQIALEALHAPVIAYGTQVDGLDEATCHELRKDLKALRYGLDILKVCYPADAADAFIETLKQLQARLGEIGDAPLIADAPEEARIDITGSRAAAQEHWEKFLALPSPWLASPPGPGDQP